MLWDSTGEYDEKWGRTLTEMNTNLLFTVSSFEKRNYEEYQKFLIKYSLFRRIHLSVEL